MKADAYSSRLAMLKSKLSGWMMIALAMAGSNLLLVGMLMASSTPEKTIIVPAETRRSFWIQGDKVSPEYYLEMAEFFVAKLLTYNPANAEGQFADVLKSMNPGAYNVMQAKFKTEVNSIKSQQLSSVFYQEQIKAMGNKVIGYGEQVSMMAGQVISHQKIGYELAFTYRDGKLFVDSFRKLDMPASGIAGYEELLKTQGASQ